MPASQEAKGRAHEGARDRREGLAVDLQLGAVGFLGGGPVGEVGGLEVDHRPMAVPAVGEVDLAGGEEAFAHRDREGELAVDEAAEVGVPRCGWG